MAKQLQEYIVVHPLRHNGKPYAPGAKVSLDETDALRLIGFGSVQPAGAVVVLQVPVVTPLSAATLAKLNVAELVEHGNSAYGLGLTADLKREAIMEAIQTAITSRTSTSVAQDLATEHLEGAGLGERF